MDVNELFNLQSCEQFSEFERNNVSYLLEAINDWPTDVATVAEYFSKVKRFLSREELTYLVLEEASAGYAACRTAPPQITCGR